MRPLRMILIAIALTATVSGVFAQPVETPDLVSELARELARSGWSREEIAEFAASATEMDWDDARGASAEVVALALTYYRGQTEDEADGRELAVMGLEVARVAAVMGRAGVPQVDIARATVAGTRDALQTPADPATAAGPGFAASVRERMVEQVRARARVTAAGRGPTAAREVLRGLGDSRGHGVPVDGVPVGPPESPGATPR